MDESDPHESAAQERVGRTLCGKWVIERLLGVGGMASVYGATHHNNLKAVAVKVLHPELSTNAEIKRRFLREGYLANRVGHPNVVSVLDDDVDDDGTVFLVMELFEGETLHDRYHGGGPPLTTAEVLDIVDQLLDVLVTAHAAGIVHRDLKPDNIFLTREGQIKVLDFGIARVIDPDDPTKTQVGIILGTPSYMAPEQARGESENIDGRTDLWAVGAIMFALLSGQRVHEAESMHERLALAMHREAPPLRSVEPGAPEALANVIDKALAFEPSKRWQDATAMREALRAARQTMESNPQARVTLHTHAPGLPVPAGVARMSGAPRDANRTRLPTQRVVRKSSGRVALFFILLSLTLAGIALAYGLRDRIQGINPFGQPRSKVRGLAPQPGAAREAQAGAPAMAAPTQPWSADAALGTSTGDGGIDGGVALDEDAGLFDEELADDETLELDLSDLLAKDDQPSTSRASKGKRVRKRIVYRRTYRVRRSHGRRTLFRKRRRR